jgi:hypothetical protein
VTAFDIFEHFMDTARACRNILGFLKPGGKLIIETGDWRSVKDLSSWYYVNLFEHQVFWSRRSIEFLSNLAGLTIEECQRVNHKGRRGSSIVKRAALETFRALGFITGPVTGIDARLVPPPALKDHLFAVLRKDARLMSAAFA